MPPVFENTAEDWKYWMIFQFHDKPVPTRLLRTDRLPRFLPLHCQIYWYWVLMLLDLILVALSIRFNQWLLLAAVLIHSLCPLLLDFTLFRFIISCGEIITLAALFMDDAAFIFVSHLGVMFTHNQTNICSVRPASYFFLLLSTPMLDQTMGCSECPAGQATISMTVTTLNPATKNFTSFFLVVQNQERHSCVIGLWGFRLSHHIHVLSKKLTFIPSRRASPWLISVARILWITWPKTASERRIHTSWFATHLTLRRKGTVMKSLSYCITNLRQ